MAAATPSKQKTTTTLDQELRELISALSTRCRTINVNPTTGLNQDARHDDDTQAAARIIMLVGSNVGATMRGETVMDEKPDDHDQSEHQSEQLELEEFVTSLNSNFQAINNSIMLGGSYDNNDPGVHLEISDYVNRDKKHRSKRPYNKLSDHGYNNANDGAGGQGN